MNIIYRGLTAIPFEASSPKTLELPKREIAAGILLNMQGELVVTGAGTVNDENPQALLREISILANGREMQRWTGNGLAAHDFSNRGRFRHRIITGAGVATYPFRYLYWLPFETFRSGNRSKSLLDPGRFSTFDLRIQWGDVPDLVTGATATITAASTFVTPQIVEVQGARGGIYQDQLVQYTRKVLSAANNAEKFDLPRTRPVTQFLVRVSDAATGRILDSTSILNVRLLMDATEITKQTWQQHQDVINDRLSPVTTYQTPPAGQTMEGYMTWIFPYFSDGEILDPRGASELYFELDHTGSIVVEVWTVSHVPASVA